jgi:hypothetical protein
VAEAYANALDLFITRDENAIRYLAEPAAEFGIEVLHPTEILTFLDVEQADRTYQPARLAQTTFTVQRLDRALTTEEVSLLLDKSGGERLGDLKRLLKDLAGRSTEDVQRIVLLDGHGILRAAWAYTETGSLDVPLLRVVSGHLQTTLALQLSQMLRNVAVAGRHTVIRVTDPHVSPSVRSLLDSDGFHDRPDGLVAIALPLVGSWAEISAAAQHAVEGQGSEGLDHLLDLPEDPSLAQTIEFERMWAPARILVVCLRFSKAILDRIEHGRCGVDDDGRAEARAGKDGPLGRVAAPYGDAGSGVAVGR